MISRDFSQDKRDVVNRMSGNVTELFDPANADGRINNYPNAYCPPPAAAASASASTTADGSAPPESLLTFTAEPSIRGRTLYVPLNTWFSLNSRCAFPLVATPLGEIVITLTLRPIQELMQIRDVFNNVQQAPYVQPDFNRDYMRMYRFLQTPPYDVTNSVNYTNTACTWNADVHLLATYAFLSDDERAVFASETQTYLIRDVHEYTELNVVGTKRMALNSNGMVSSWMVQLQRNDVNQRNEWSNYTNWAYLLNKPQNVQFPPYEAGSTPGLSPLLQPDGSSTGFYVTGSYSTYNQKQILQTMAVVLDGKYRENDFEAGAYSYIEQLAHSVGSGADSLYSYNFCLNTSPFVYQPSGAMNMSMFRTVELEISTYIPPLNSYGANVDILCAQGQVFGLTSKPSWMIYEYGYNVRVMEERMNVLNFAGGVCGLQFAR